jgi:hypothetical protein
METLLQEVFRNIATGGLQKLKVVAERGKKSSNTFRLPPFISHSIDVKLYFHSSIIRDVDLIHSDAAVPRIPKDKEMICGDQCLCSVLTQTRGKVLHISSTAV